MRVPGCQCRRSPSNPWHRAGQLCSGAPGGIGLTLAALLCVARTRAEIAAGTTVDQTTVDGVRDLLPPDIYAHDKAGEYTNKVVDFPNSRFQWDDGFAEASRANREHLTLDAKKQPVDRETGKRPDYITGHPFPDIREDDPDAGIKILWNMAYTVYNGGNSRNVTSLGWVSPTGIDRSSPST